MDISLRELKHLVQPGLTHSFELGKAYLIRTVTMYYTGRISAITDTDLVLTTASWIADTGRFSNALETGELSEVEPFIDEVIISRSAIIDATQWRHDLPKATK